MAEYEKHIQMWPEYLMTDDLMTSTLTNHPWWKNQQQTVTRWLGSGRDLEGYQEFLEVRSQWELYTHKMGPLAVTPQKVGWNHPRQTLWFSAIYRGPISHHVYK